MNEMPIEKKEFWGITGPSLLACTGTLVALGSAWLWLKHPLGVAPGIIGLVMIGFALRANLTQGLNVKWRKTNVIMHVIMLVLSLVVICLSGVLKHITGS